VPQSFGGGFESLNPQIHTSGGSIDPVWGDPLPDLIEGGIAGELESAGLAFDMEIETSIEASVGKFQVSRATGSRRILKNSSQF
jgi:hypothetical protein